jgi:hypothetical protein
MYIVTIEEVKEEQCLSIIGTKKRKTTERTIYHQELDSIDLVAVIKAINEKK